MDHHTGCKWSALGRKYHKENQLLSLLIILSFVYKSYIKEVHGN